MSRMPAACQSQRQMAEPWLDLLSQTQQYRESHKQSPFWSPILLACKGPGSNIFMETHFKCFFLVFIFVFILGTLATLGFMEQGKEDTDSQVIGNQMSSSFLLFFIVFYKTIFFILHVNPSSLSLLSIALLWHFVGARDRLSFIDS